jgi:5-methyltetrahydrofolate--homocysteine methyltransferase
VEGVTKGTVVIATVYGDVHDIGKNLVKTILANNGYTVIDLGKQVPAETIITESVKANATAIGLVCVAGFHLQADAAHRQRNAAPWT